jgi:hypothetical protein
MLNRHEATRDEARDPGARSGARDVRARDVRARGALRWVLAEAPRALAPERVAFATVAAIAAGASLQLAATVPEIAREVRAGAGAPGVVVGITVAFALAVTRIALRARTQLAARLWLTVGAGLAGAVATWASHLLVVLLGAPPQELQLRVALVGGLLFGGVAGFVVGTGFTPVVIAARRAIATPSHDGADRVLFASGASLVALWAGRALLGGLGAREGDPFGTTALVAGLAIAGVAAARLVARIRFVARARDGSEPGLHVVPTSHAEDEQPLLPLVRTTRPPSGVLAATGASAPYRGARGIFKLGLAPLPSERFDRPIAVLVQGAVRHAANCVVTLCLGAAALVISCPILAIAAIAVVG